MHPHNPNPRTGQAMIELMLGIILIMLLLTGTMQFLAIAMAHAAIDGDIRGQAGYRAMQPLSHEDAPRCIRDWSPGPDGQRFTADDVASLGRVDTLIQITDHSTPDPATWRIFDQLSNPSSLATMHTTPVAAQTSLGFVHQQVTTLVPVSQAAQQLYYNRPYVTVQEDCWIPIMNTLY